MERRQAGESRSQISISGQSSVDDSWARAAPAAPSQTTRARQIRPGKRRFKSASPRPTRHYRCPYHLKRTDAKARSPRTAIMADTSEESEYPASFETFLSRRLY